MNFRKVTMLVLMTLVSASLFLPSQAKAQVTRQITSSGTTQLRSAPPGTPGIQNPEVDPAIVGDGDSDSMSDGGNGVGTYINRSIAPGHGHGLSVASGRKAKSNPEVGNSFEGLNFFDQRYANGGNQFSVVPPDQGLCVGNGYVLESVNDVLDVYSSDGHSLLGTTDLNTFYNYPAAINRTTGAYGPSITDPSCHFDTASQRWFHVVLTLDRVGTSSSLSGKNHLDIAVSTTANPLDPWTIYRLPVQDDGTDGTPDHHCIAATRNGPVHGQHGTALDGLPAGQRGVAEEPEWPWRQVRVDHQDALLAAGHAQPIDKR